MPVFRGSNAWGQEMKDIFTSSNFRDLDEHINESEDSEALRKEFEDMTGEEFPYDPPSMSEICS